MDDQFDLVAMAGEDRADGRSVPDVDVVVSVPRAEGPFQEFALPGGRRILSEKKGPHVIIDSDYVHTEVGEVSCGCGADQPSGPGDHCHTHEIPLRASTGGNARETIGPAQEGV